MENFSSHAPKNFDWLTKYISKLGVKQVLKDYEKMYDWLIAKPIGWVYHLNYAKGLQDRESRDYKIKLICMFIADNHYDFEFNKTFTELKRVKINVKQKKLDEDGDEVAD